MARKSLAMMRAELTAATEKFKGEMQATSNSLLKKYNEDLRAEVAALLAELDGISEGLKGLR